MKLYRVFTENLRIFVTCYNLGDGLKLKIQKKKKRRKKHDIEAERTARLRELYGVQMDSDSQQDSLSGMRVSDIAICEKFQYLKKYFSY
jgi:hypothetical protein